MQVVGNLAGVYKNQAVDGFLVGFERCAGAAARVARLASGGQGLAGIFEHTLDLVVVDEGAAIRLLRENRDTILGLLLLDVVDFFLG